MCDSVDIFIGTGANHVFRVAGEERAPLAEVARPTFLTRARGYVFGVSEIGHGGVFRVGSDPTPGDTISSGGTHPCHISAAPDGSWLYVSNYGDAVVRAIEVTPEGEFGETVDLAHSGSGPVANRQGSAHAHFSAVVDEQLIIADLGADQLRVHALTRGRPAKTARLVDLPSGSGPRHFAQRGRELLVAGELDGTVTEVSLDTWRPGRSVPAATVKGEHALSHILAFEDVIIVGVRGSNTLTVLDEHLTIVQEIPTASWPRHFAAAPSGEGEAVVVAGERSDEVVWHPVAREGGAITLGSITDRVAVSTPMFIGVGEGF